MLASKSAKGWIWARNIASLAALVAVGISIGNWAQALSKEDPFAALRPRQVEGVREEAGITLNDVEFSYYRDGKLATRAEVEKFEVIRDRITYDMTGIRNGVIKTGDPKKPEINFASASGSWRNDTRQLDLKGKARVAGKDFDFTTETITVQEANKLITIPGPITGKLDKGIGRAKSGRINYESEKWDLKGVRYIGTLPGVFQESGLPSQNRTAWDIRSESMQDSGKETRIMTQIDATATDGEMLLKAPKIELDRKTDVLTATGRVFYYSAKANVVADKVVVFRKDKRAVFTGNVVMLVKPKDEEVDYKPTEEELPPFRPLVPDDIKATRPEGGFGPSQQEKELDRKLRDGDTLREFPLTLLAKNIEYFYRKGGRRAKIEGDPQGRQELPEGRWRNVWCFAADYDGEAETLRALSKEGTATCRMKNSIGDDLTAQTFLIHTKEGDERFSAEKIKGRVFTDPDDDPRDDKKNPPAKSTGGGAGSGGGSTRTGTSSGSNGNGVG